MVSCHFNIHHSSASVRLPWLNTAMASELADAKRRIRELEEELRATKLAASMLKDDGIRPKGASRSLKP